MVNSTQVVEFVSCSYTQYLFIASPNILGLEKEFQKTFM